MACSYERLFFRVLGRAALDVISNISRAGDQVTTNIEYRIPIAGPVQFAIFDDFDITAVVRQSQLRQSVEGADQLNSPLYGCPSYFNGACQGGQATSSTL